MNTVSLYAVLFCLPAVTICIPVHVSTQYALGLPRSGFGGESNSFDGGSEASGGSFGGLDEGGSGQNHEHYHEHHHEEEHHEPKPYGFGYAVKDFKKGTSFSQHESSDGHNIKGEYEVALPDGRLQVVKYNADWKNGFNADIKYHGESHHPEVYATHESSGHEYKSY